MYGQSPNELEQLIFFLEQRKVVETSSSAWKADIFTVIRPLHIRTQLTKHYCTITGELGIIVKEINKRYATIL